MDLEKISGKIYSQRVRIINFCMVTCIISIVNWASQAFGAETYDFNSLFKVDTSNLVEMFDIRNDPSAPLMSVMLFTALWAVACLDTINREVTREKLRIAELEKEAGIELLSIAPVDTVDKCLADMEDISVMKGAVEKNNQQIAEIERRIAWIDNQEANLNTTI